jgi:hypothetical protein
MCISASDLSYIIRWVYMIVEVLIIEFGYVLKNELLDDIIFSELFIEFFPKLRFCEFVDEVIQ